MTLTLNSDRSNVLGTKEPHQVNKPPHLGNQEPQLGKQGPKSCNQAQLRQPGIPNQGLSLVTKGTKPMYRRLPYHFVFSPENGPFNAQNS